MTSMKTFLGAAALALTTMGLSSCDNATEQAQKQEELNQWMSKNPQKIEALINHYKNNPEACAESAAQTIVSEDFSYLRQLSQIFVTMNARNSTAFKALLIKKLHVNQGR